jgi:hypothetical protein
MAKREAPQPYAAAIAPLHITGAIKLLHAGTASASQQQAALKWIIEGLCGTYDMSYRPESDRDTAFAEGKRHVGNQIIRQINLVMPERR